MEKDIEVIYETNEFVVDKVVELNSRIYDHHLDYTNWHLALLDEKSGVSLINQNFENFCNFEKTHKDKINMIKCLEKHVVTVADDKTLKFWSKDTKKLEATLKCKNYFFPKFF